MIGNIAGTRHSSSESLIQAQNCVMFRIRLIANSLKLRLSFALRNSFDHLHTHQIIINTKK